MKQGSKQGGRPKGKLQLGIPWGPTAPLPEKAEYPFVFLNAAMTADGKLAPASRQFEPFSSRRDRLLMYELRAYSDAIMSGARTVDLNPVQLGNGGRAYTATRLKRRLAEFPVRVIVTGRGSIDPKAEIFRHRFSPIIVLTSDRAPASRLKKLRGLADEVATFGKEHVDFKEALRWLRAKWGVRRLLCEGGGEVNAALFAADLVDELYLTICPLIFGGRNAPTVADGEGVDAVAAATKCEIRAMKRVEDELFLIYRVKRA